MLDMILFIQDLGYSWHAKMGLQNQILVSLSTGSVDPLPKNVWCLAKLQFQI